MSLILNIETATTVCSVSLAKDGTTIAVKELGGEYTHAENLTLFMQDVLHQAGITFKEIDAVAVSEGPGSYTGLRIGVSAAKGLCYALNKPLIAVDTLQHFALSVSQNVSYRDSEALYSPMIDARRMEVYNAIYDSDNKPVLPTGARIINKESFSELIRQHKIYFFGNGAAKCKDVLGNALNAIFVSDIELSATSMSAISFKLFEKQQYQDLAYFEPRYLKDFIIKSK